MKIVIDSKIPYIKGALDSLADVVYVDGSAITAADVRDADALIVRTRTRCDATLLAGSRVSAIFTATIGFDHIDTDYCAAHSIHWQNAPGCNAASVRQYVMSVFAYMHRRLGTTLAGARLAVVGVGNVGRQIVELALNLGMEVMPVDPVRARREPTEYFYGYRDALSRADIITYHTPLTLQGRHRTFHLYDSLCGRILVAQQPVGGFVLLNLRETAHRRVKTVVGVVIVALAHFPQQHRAGTFFHGEIVVQILLHMDALTGGQTNLGAGRHCVSTAVRMHRDIAFVVDLLIGQAIVDPDQAVAAAPVDDILGFIPVEVVGRILPLLQIQQLLGINLGILLRHCPVAVADGNQREAEFVEIPLAIVRYIPAQHTVTHLIIFVTHALPLLRGEMAEGRQIAVLLFAHCLQLFQCLVNFRTLHGHSSRYFPSG